MALSTHTQVHTQSGEKEEERERETEGREGARGMRDREGWKRKRGKGRREKRMGTRLYRIVLVVHGACGARKVVNLIHLQLYGPFHSHPDTHPEWERRGGAKRKWERRDAGEREG